MKRLHVEIRRQAQDKDLNQREVSDLTGISHMTINRLWRGKNVHAVTFVHLEKIAEVLGCSPLEFFSVVEVEADKQATST